MSVRRRILALQIASEPSLIQTVRGIGYMVSKQPQTADLSKF